MPGDKCAVVNCGTNRPTKGTGIFNLRSKKTASCVAKAMTPRDNKKENSQRTL